MALAFCAFPAVVLSSPITYTVDPSQSSLTLSGTWGGYTVVSQLTAPNTLIASLAGNITADRDFVQDTLQITGGSVAAQNNGAYVDLADTPADFGIVPNGSLDNVGAIVDFAVSLSSLPINSPESFDASQVTADVGSGQFHYVSGGSSYPGGPIIVSDTYVAISGSLLLASGSASVADADGIETLTIPVGFDLPIETSLILDPLAINLSGVIVATAPIPEPASLSVLAVPAFVILCKRRNRRIRRL
jgi:hypothetical protein